MVRCIGLYPATMTIADFKAQVDPYRFGFPAEISVSEAGETAVARHYSMGRVTVELANVMPDNKTACISDDGKWIDLGHADDAAVAAAIAKGT